MRVSFVTFGCKVNQYETEYMAERLERAGHVVVDGSADVDIFIVNSCAVTNTAERKVEHEIRKLRRRFPRAKIVLVGCYPQLHREPPEGVDLVLGNGEKGRIEEYIEKSGVFVSRAYWLGDGKLERVESGYGDMTRAYVKVEDGCDRSCTYCAIKLARGTRIRSKRVKDVVDEVRRLVDRGYREIVITGINLGRYGLDTGERLVDLLESMEKIEGDFRYRLSSMNPEDVDEELIVAFRDLPRLCHHLHLSLQSGSNEVLRRMGRSYTVEEYLGIVESLREIDEDFSITTDIIVGFPGEGEEDFKKTLEIVEKVSFSRVHVFRFSPKKGTPAERMGDQVPGNVKKERAEILIDLSRKVALDYRERAVGKRRRVLIERFRNGLATGYDEYYVIHEFHSEKREGFEEVVVRKVTEEGVVSRSAGVVWEGVERGEA